MDRTPALSREIGGDKQIAREQRRRNGFDPSRMPPPFEIPRQIGAKTLTLQMQRGLGLAVRSRLHHVPALAGNEGHHAASLLLPRRSSEGTKTRSWPKRAATAANVVLAIVRSVTMTPSMFASISSNEACTGNVTKRDRVECASTTAMIWMPRSSAQMVAISARSETPAKAMCFQPRASADASTSEQSARARRKNE